MQKHVHLVDLVKIQELSSEYLLSKHDLDTAENEPFSVWGRFNSSSQSIPQALADADADHILAAAHACATTGLWPRALELLRADAADARASTAAMQACTRARPQKRPPRCVQISVPIQPKTGQFLR